MNDDRRFTAEMLRPYEYIFKNEMHPSAFTYTKKIIFSICGTTSQPQAKINSITHNAGEITVEILQTKHNIEILCDRLTNLQYCL